MTFYQIKKMILNARYTAVRMYGTNVYTNVRVPNLCCAFREFSTQNINRTIDWRDIGQCNLNGHKQKSKIYKHPPFEFILTLSVNFWSFQVISTQHKLCYIIMMETVRFLKKGFNRHSESGTPGLKYDRKF